MCVRIRVYVCICVRVSDHNYLKSYYHNQNFIIINKPMCACVGGWVGGWVLGDERGEWLFADHTIQYKSFFLFP